MNSIPVQPFYIIGLAIRTTNENNQSATDIPALWGKFFSENIMAGIPNKIDNNIYCVYTDYEKDHTKPYTTLLGCKVSAIADIPETLTGKSFTGGKYVVYTAEGKMTDNIVFKEWLSIWMQILTGLILQTLKCTMKERRILSMLWLIFL